MRLIIETANDGLEITDKVQAAPFGAAATRGFETAPGAGRVEAAWLLAGDSAACRLFPLGLDAESTPRLFRECGLQLGRMIGDATSFAVDLRSMTGLQPEASAALCEGIALGCFRPRTAFVPLLRLVLSEKADQMAHRQAIDDALVVARWTNWARDLVECPAGELGPAALASEIATRAGELGIAAEVWDEARMEAEGFGATLGVGRGSDTVTRVVVLRHGGGIAPLGLTGKGVTFDTGGLNLKRDLEEIGYMKSDMAGAAAVAGAVFAAVALNRAPETIAVLPLVENMPSGRALRPGDRVRHPDDTTTEVVDTDCEGRLVLADALSWLTRQNVRALIDVGTLSDGGGVGPEFWGLWSNAPALAERLTRAGSLAGDPGWHLPLRDEGRTLLASRIADRCNTRIGEPDTGQVAACYLSQFTGGTAWAHIDNGSNAWLLRDTYPWPEGATGAPLRALTRFLCDET